TRRTALLKGQMLNQEGLWQLIVQGSAPFNIEELLQRFRDCTNQEQEDDQTLLSLEVL
ncbi:MAG: fused response regulator/phosphatase, partial [Spirulina sp. SIO3F2]|nr:fused response regulator/phosphatase [Spirulina sp. SIO3F2]